MRFILTAAILCAATPAWAITFENVTWLRCYDGDTCAFNLPSIHPLFGKKISVRIRGIDTPEIRGKCAAEKRKAEAARDFLRNLLRDAQRIDLVDAERRKYFRIVATVQADGRNVAALMIERGLARSYRGGKRKGGADPVHCEAVTIYRGNTT
ncbi:MAG: thermonuclease family protein [SAR324 cluster bacterium]|nr:thermonuclease family protein [SAR324 cluster bacterium]